MRTTCFKPLAAFVAVASMAFPVATAVAQESSATYTQSEPSAAPAPAPHLAYGVSQILQLQQANVGDDTIISYIKNSRNSYGLNAEQIIYLRQQGLSAAVLNAMLSQPHPGVIASSGVAMPSSPAPNVSDLQPMPQPVSAPTSIVGPSVSAIDPTAAAAAATTYYYYQPYSYPVYSYPYYYPAYGYYGYYPGVSLSFGWRGGWGGGGWHGGGGFHGGGWGGGFHGGGGGFHGGHR